MNESTNGKLLTGEYEYPLSHFKILEQTEGYFGGHVELVIDGDSYPEVAEDETYVARIVVNGDAVWYFPWVWFKQTNPDEAITFDTHGPIFCPLGLSKADEEKYDAINLIISTDACNTMTVEVWKNLMLVFRDWLAERGIPQSKVFKQLADDVPVEEEVEA